MSLSRTSDDLPTRGGDEPDDAAAAWLARLRASDVTDAERGDFAEWLAADARHGAAFDALLEVWQDLEVVGELAAAEPVAVRSPRLRQPLAWAAIFVLTLTGVLLADLSRHVHETAVGEQRRIVLEDGSSVLLNTASELAVNIRGQRRDVTLREGEAFFEVVPDANRPFVVTTRDGSVTVHGTAFAVRLYGDATRVVVREGSVRAHSGSSDAELRPDQVARLNAGTITVDEIDSRAATAWTDGQLIYDGVPLGDVIADLNRYLPVTMTIPDEALRRQRVSATLTIQDQTAMLDALALSLPLTWTRLSDKLIMIQPRA